MATEIDLERAPRDLTGSRASSFDRSEWLYAFMREHCFRDDTDRIDVALWEGAPPRQGTLLIDIGCGPGTYTRRLAQRHPGLRALGIDHSPRQLIRARDHARQVGADNCRFQLGDALRLPLADGSVDAAVASRLLMVLSDPAGALAEIYRTLRPGGRCFIAEPRPGLWTALPTMVMRIVDRAAGAVNPAPIPGDDADWAALLNTQPWSCVTASGDRRYRYAICERSAA
ncbi:MAG: class I SAM-dependent methyltransferase [Chloroflexota bacterium]|nr:class I SAM-dependent methyltransferase [Chloroflexota bacterium]